MNISTVVAMGLAAGVLVVGMRATEVGIKRVSVTELKLVGETAVSEHEAARLILTGGSCVTDGNFPNSVMSGNFPNSVMSGNFPDSVMSGNFPTSKPAISGDALKAASARATVPSPQLAL